LLGTSLTEVPLALANTRAATVIGFVHFFIMLNTLTIYAGPQAAAPEPHPGSG
jgi:spermidine/putrescine transport system permease protein